MVGFCVSIVFDEYRYIVNVIVNCDEELVEMLMCCYIFYLKNNIEKKFNYG